MKNCIEDVLGYEHPSSDKPYKLYKFIEENWKDDWDSITASWKCKIESIFNEEFEMAQVEEMAAVTKE